MENDLFYVPNKFADPPIFIDPIPVPPDPYGDGTKPPIWLPPAPIDDDPKNGNGAAFRSYTYSGIVRDAYTEQPLPGATVTVSAGRAMYSQAADRNGAFSITADSQPMELISITEVSHKPYSWPASEVQHVFDLEPAVKDIDPVVLPPGIRPKQNYWVWIIGGLAIAKWQKWI